MSARTEEGGARADHRAAKDRLYDGFALIGKALSSGRRLEILDLLAQGPRTVEAIAEEIDQSVANTSRHLQVLAAYGVVSSRRQGRNIVYSQLPGAGTLVTDLERLAFDQIEALERLADDFLSSRDDIEWLTRTELRRQLRRGTLVLIDVRPNADYESGHIDGALSIPVDELTTRIAEVPDGEPIVVYCRGPFCVKGDRAVRILRSAGIRALRLEDGYPQWARTEAHR